MKDFMRLREHLPAHIFFIQGLFPPGQGATIGVDFMIKTVEVNGEKIKASPLQTSNIKKSSSLLYPPQTKFRGYIVILMSVRSCVRPSVRPNL